MNFETPPTPDNQAEESAGDLERQGSENPAEAMTGGDLEAHASLVETAGENAANIEAPETPQTIAEQVETPGETTQAEQIQDDAIAKLESFESSGDPAQDAREFLKVTERVSYIDEIADLPPHIQAHLLRRRLMELAEFHQDWLNPDSEMSRRLGIVGRLYADGATTGERYRRHIDQPSAELRLLSQILDQWPELLAETLKSEIETVRKELMDRLEAHRRWFSEIERRCGVLAQREASAERNGNYTLKGPRLLEEVALKQKGVEELIASVESFGVTSDSALGSTEVIDRLVMIADLIDAKLKPSEESVDFSLREAEARIDSNPKPPEESVDLPLEEAEGRIEEIGPVLEAPQDGMP